MATAIETSSDKKTPNPPANLLFASVAGGIYVLASFAIVFFVLPRLIKSLFGTGADILIEYAVGLTFTVLALAILFRIGQILAGSNPPKGLRGGIFLVISAIFTNFFLIRAVGLNVTGTPGMALTAAIGVALIVLTIRFFMGKRAERWMVNFEHSGLFSTSTYKSMLGQRVRRLTILGILLVGGSGVYALWTKSMLPSGDWVLALPFTDATVTLLPMVQYTAPLLLLAFTGWFAWRVTNMPTFAEFLIATEAEMNKVSWSTRKQLTQDTIVVLATTFLMTLFLFAVDIFWGWLLSREVVGVLPSRADTKKNIQQNQTPQW